MTTQDIKVENVSSTVVIVEVNNHSVKMPEKFATGLEIKEEAIKQGVNIQTNFVVLVQLSNGSSKVIGDDDKVLLNELLVFSAIAPDDNS